VRPIQELIDKYQERLNHTIDPDNASWDDLGFDEPPEGYESPFEFQRLHSERDEGDQAKEGLIGEFIEDLKALQKELMDEQTIKSVKGPRRSGTKTRTIATASPKRPKKRK
jgi:hypothetical protein